MSLERIPPTSDCDGPCSHCEENGRREERERWAKRALELARWHEDSGRRRKLDNHRDEALCHVGGMVAMEDFARELAADQKEPASAEASAGSERDGP